jgi:glycosyltransferase involved in cell wall biosynthesis
MKIDNIMKGRDFIITGLQSWDIPIGSNAIDIAKEIAVENRVLYVNSPLDMMTIFRNKPTPETIQRLEVYRKKKAPLRQITDTLWVLDFPFWIWSVNGLPDGLLFDFFNKLNNKKIFNYVGKVANDLNFKNPIHFIDNDIYRSFYSKEILKPALSVYYRRDNLQAIDFWKSHAPRLEPMLIGKSDLIVANSPQLAAFARKFNTQSFDVGQGVDLSAYDLSLEFKEPAEFETIPKPRIGYIGDITSLRLDADLIYELAKSKPQYSFVMIGRVDKLFAAHAMNGLKNVHFLGSVAKNMVPTYMSALQVCLNPQLLNELTIGNYPRKVDEYLALGKPVIATKTDTMELFREHSYLCSSVADYQEAVEKALQEDNEEKAKQRILFAESHSWKNNVDSILKRIQEALTKK